ncbi:MAG TPA: methyltransferase domain-containing protein [Candidatus Acidoferrales bacterium]|jgi:SAM-dependent methyltransferase|nr:methyltransferase domain-containing protein [Candidatus Acidoferrales bacterium]
MEISAWNDRYRTGDRAAGDLEPSPNPLLADTAAKLPPGKALDLACGTGRNAVWLAERGWQVTAVDGASAAIELLHQRAAARGVSVEAHVANLEKNEFRIEPAAWDFIAMCFYLQVSLFEPSKRGLRPGGIVLVIVHITAPDEKPTEHRLRPSELKNYFSDFEILHYREGAPNDPAHKRLCAELVARRPTS